MGSVLALLTAREGALTAGSVSVTTGIVTGTKGRCAEVQSVESVSAGFAGAG